MKRSLNSIKMAKRFTIRPQKPCPKGSYMNLEDAYNAALDFAQSSGKDVSVIEHDGDITRLVKKVFHV